MIGSTNRRKQIDEAMLRRMPSQVFVGKPGPETRRELFTSIIEGAGFQVKKDSMDSFVAYTTNFSGAAIVYLAYALIDLLKSNKQGLDFDQESRKILCNTCEAFSVKVGHSYKLIMLYINIFYIPHYII